jgi:putative peptidoglycan lipid II flippase
VLSEYARQGRPALVQAGSALLSVFVVLLAGVVLLLEVTAPHLAFLLAGGLAGFDPELLALTTQLIRWLAPAVWVLSVAGVWVALLYALQRFALLSLATAVFNLGMVLAAPLLAPLLGIFSLAVGLLLGSLAQLLLVAFDLRRAGLALRLTLRFDHPALRRILRLYLPIAAGLAVSLLQVGLDRRLASATGAQSIAWMANATTLQQLPLGLVSVAISLAALPRLSQFFAAGDEHGYRQTLASGLRMVWMWVLPAGVLLWLLGTPVTRLLFERGAFTPLDTAQVAQALNLYLLGMLCAAVDYPLNFAFYARFNTWLPAAVGVLSVILYTVVALALVQRLGFLLLWRFVGPLRGKTLQGFAQVGLAGGAMAATVSLIAQPLRSWLPPGWAGDLALVSLASTVGLSVYGWLLWTMKLAEAQQIGLFLQTRLRRRTAPPLDSA